MQHQAPKRNILHSDLLPSPQFPKVLLKALLNMRGLAHINNSVFEQELINALRKLFLLLELRQFFQSLLSESAAGHGLQALFQLLGNGARKVEIEQFKQAAL